MNIELFLSYIYCKLLNKLTSLDKNNFNVNKWIYLVNLSIFRDLQGKSFKYFKGLAKTLCLIMV